MNTKIEAVITAALSGLFGFLSFLANTPPEQQAQLLGHLVEIVPVDWRPTVAVWAKTASTLLAFYATYKAAQSGPKPLPPPQQ